MTTEKIKSLLLMNENKKITVTLLAKKMNVSKATMSRMINTFYEQGLTLDKGKCQLSKKGQEYIEKIQEKIKNLTYWLQETSHLNEEEARQEAIKNRPAGQRCNSKQIDVIETENGTVETWGYPVVAARKHIGVLTTTIVKGKDGNVISTASTWVPGDITVKSKKGLDYMDMILKTTDSAKISRGKWR